MQALETYIQSGQQVSIGGESVIQQQPQQKRTRTDSIADEVSGLQISDHQPMEVNQDTTNRKRFHSNGNADDPIKSGRSRISILDKPKEYSAYGLKNVLHGNIYQLKLLMLFLKRGLDKGYSFRLATEMDAAEKFDDLVFQYENERKDGIVYRFLQAKHKQDKPKKVTISANDLLTETDDDFSLQKYFISYRKIKQNPEFTGKNDELKDFVICTNIDLDDDLQNSFERVVDEDNILDTDVQNNSKEPKRLKLEIDNFSEKERIVSILKSTSDLIRLARRLADCVLSSKPLNLDDNLFKLYHDALAREIIDVEDVREKEENNKGKTVKKVYARFRNVFLDGSPDLSTQAKDFRSYFLDTCLKMQKDQEDVHEFWKDMKTKELQISKNFGKVFKLDNNPLTDSKGLAQVIANAISTAQQGIVNVNRERGRGKGIIKDNINRLAGHIAN